jgi:hypothetical protein
MAQENDDKKGGDGKDFADKRTFNKPGVDRESQHDPNDQDEKRRLGQFGGAGEHPRDTGRGNRHK